MKTINSFRSKLFALTLALMASVSTFAYDYHGDLLCYNVLTDSTVAVTGQSEYKTMPRYEYLPENLVIPAEVTLQGKTYKVVSIDQWAFYACTMLKSVTIPSSVTFIGMSAFHYCENLVYVDIPTSVTTVEGSAFSYTKWYDNLPDGEVYINNTLYRYKGTAPENTQIVVKDGTTRIAGYTFWNQSNIVSIELPQTLTVIEHDVFEGCTQLSSILIPKNVTYIGASAFADCTGLTEVICLAPTPPTMGQYANPSADSEIFARVDVSNTTLYVRSESVEAYKNVDQWKEFGQILPIESTIDYKSQWCNTWNLFRHSGGARLDSEETWQYKLDRDTIINGKLYSTVIYYLTSDPSREYYMGAVRFGDDRKVYRAIGNSESVVYDFTAQVGDTLGPGVVYDVEVDSLTNLKTIYFHPYDRYEDKYIEYATVEWIEGVGSTDGFLLAIDYGTAGGPSFYLLCAYRDDELKYAANKDLGCRYNAGEVTHDHFPTLAGLSRTIHEERSTNDTTRRDDFTKVVLDRKFPTLYHSQMYLRERDNKIFVESRTYKNLTELYEYVLYDFTLEVGDSLPMLYIDYSSRGDWGPTYPLSILNVVNYRKEADGTIYPGDTLVVTEVSTITLLDGKEYKKWTFNNGMEYAEGIGSLSGDFYELIANKRTTEDLTASQLVCASQNGQLLYKMDDAEMERLGVECLCEYNSGPKKDNAKNGKIGGRPTPTQWNMLEFETKEVDGTPTITRAETFNYTLENDSIVTKGKTFYQLARQSTKDTAITKSFVGALHFGEDEDNRVYFLRDGVEYVLYDFTAEPGDTIEIFAGINNYPQYTTYTHVVIGKDTLENGACRMMLEVVFPEETSTAENAQKVWLAGLGSIDGIVHNAATRATKARSSETQTSVMLCAWRDDDCLYTTDHPDYDSYGCVYNLPTSIKDIERPGGKCQKLLRDGHLYILRDNKLYDVLGTPMN